MAEQIPMFKGVREVEHQALGVDSDSAAGEHVIDWEVVPRRARLRWQSFKMGIYGTADVRYYNNAKFQLDCWWLPVYGANEMVTFDTAAEIKTYYDQVVPKVDDTVVGTNSAADWVESVADETIGDTDTSLIWQPGRISLRMLESLNSPMRLYHERFKLWAADPADAVMIGRDADSEKLRYSKVIGDFVGKGIQSDHPGYIAWVLTIPRDVADDEFPESGKFPPGSNNAKRFEGWDFLAPMWSLFNKSRSVSQADIDTWRQWSTSYYYQGGTDRKKNAQQALDVVMDRDVMFAPYIAQPAVIDPQS